MKVTATHWVNVDGVWYQAGQTYDDGNPEIAESTKRVEKAEPEQEQPKRGRKKAAKEE